MGIDGKRRFAVFPVSPFLYFLPATSPTALLSAADGGAPVVHSRDIVMRLRRSIAPLANWPRLCRVSLWAVTFVFCQLPRGGNGDALAGDEKPVRARSASTAVNEADPAESEATGAAGESVRAGGDSLLLLTTGRVVTGQVTRNGNQFLVKEPTGEMFVPAEHVAIIARDLRDCYRQLRDKLPGQSPPDEHLSLARWCLSRQLLSEARNEALETLRIDSTRDDARQLIQKIDTILNPPPVEKRSAEEVERAKLRTAYGVGDFESLGGLDREAAKLFTSRVHPILLNNCTSSGCHGANSKTEFRLERLPLGDGPRKQIVLRNLTAVLGQIDREAPEKSLLLTAKTGPHARTGRVVFAGAKGAEQARLVREWIRLVVKQDPPRPTAGADRQPGLAHHESDEGDRTSDARNAGQDGDGRAARNARLSRSGTGVAGRGKKPTERAVDVLDLSAEATESESDRELVSPPRDAFDPSGFNADANPR